MLGLGTLARKIFGSENDRKLKPKFDRVKAINALEPEFQALSDEGLIARTRALGSAPSGKRRKSSCARVVANRK